ncbi:MAG: hypothetical protein K5864_00935 [Bacteroidales bacterium]|nr:hypothetical protein [Bacteroidales bacterium]
MRRRTTQILTLSLLCLLLASCSSSRNVNMRKHRRSRHCDCPTFGQRIDTATDNNAARFTALNTL